MTETEHPIFPKHRTFTLIAVPKWQNARLQIEIRRAQAMPW